MAIFYWNLLLDREFAKWARSNAWRRRCWISKSLNRFSFAILRRWIALHGLPLSLALTCRDAEVKEEAFLEYINQLVMTGEVAGLFPKEEMDALLNDTRPVLKKECPGQPLLHSQYSRNGVDGEEIRLTGN